MTNKSISSIRGFCCFTNIVFSGLNLNINHGAMQTGIVDMSEHMQFQFGLDTMISFKPFIDYLSHCEKQEGSVKRKLYQRALSAFSDYKICDQDIPVEEAAQY